MLIAHLRDLAVVLIAIEVFFMLLAPTVSLFLAIRGLSWLMGKIRKYGPVAHQAFRDVARVSDEVSQKVAAPVILGSANTARVRRWRVAVASQFYTKEV